MIGVLGPVELAGPDGPVGLPQRAHRVLLALLASSPSEIVMAEELIWSLWQEPVSPRRMRNLQTHIYQLRRHLAAAEPGRGGELIRTQASGYLLTVSPGDVDSEVFTALAGQARTLTRDGDAAGAAACYRRALALWRGPALADVADACLRLRAHADHLEEQRLVALEERIDVDLALGQHADLVSELYQLISRYPLRERFSHRLMLCLYRCGRQAEALEAYHAARRTIRDELGLDPGPELRELFRRILDGDQALAGPAAPEPKAAPGEVIPRQLPAGVRGFAGRAKVLAELDQLLAQPADGVPIGVISGPGGVGKTTLAVHWARRVASSFPDGQLCTDLRGFGPGDAPATSADVIRDFLTALQVPGSKIPAGEHARADLYRSLLAGRRMLVILDNAADYDQVRPLLPGAAACVVLVTSRRQLTGLLIDTGATPIELDVLGDGEARALLASRLGAARLEAEPDSVRDLIGLCKGLPLALAIVAARAAIRPGQGLAALANQMCQAASPLDAFAGTDRPGDIRGVFSWSYQQLSAPAARMFRLLGVHAGPDIGVAAAASMAGVTVPDARGQLGELVRSHLVTEAGPGRLALHDLLRAYAAELASATDTAAELRTARQRVLDHYLHTAHAAECLLQPTRAPLVLGKPLPGVVGPALDHHDSALAWLQAEYAVLLANVTEAQASGFDVHSCQLAWALRDFMYRRGHWPDLIRVQRIALAAAGRLGDVTAEAECHRALGRAYTKLGDAGQAQAQLRAALGRSELIDDWVGQAHTESEIARLLEAEGKFSESLEHLRSALVLYRRAGHRVGEAKSLNGIAWQQALLGDYEPALASCPQALAVLTEAGDRHAQAGTLDTLGFAHFRRRSYAESVACYQRALAILHDLGDLHNEALTLSQIGDVHQAAGDPAAARESWVAALRILDQLGHADAQTVRAKLARS